MNPSQSITQSTLTVVTDSIKEMATETKEGFKAINSMQSTVSTLTTYLSTALGANAKLQTQVGALEGNVATLAEQVSTLTKSPLPNVAPIAPSNDKLDSLIMRLPA